MSIRRCYRNCCFFAGKCLHGTDPIFPGTCGKDVIEGGDPCDEHPRRIPDRIPPSEPDKNEEDPCT